MSFSFGFNAKSGEDAALIVDEEGYVPDSVKALVKDVASKYPGAVKVECHGHIDIRGYESTVTLKISSISNFREPKPRG